MNTEIQQFDELAGKIKVFVGPVKDLVITDAASNAVAAGTLKTIKDMSKQIEQRRVSMVKPMNDQVSMVNARAKQINEPLDEAECLVKRLMATFADSERIKREAEQKRLDEEHRSEQERIRKEAHARQKALDDTAALERKRLDDEQKTREKEAAEKRKIADSKPSFFGSASTEAKQKEEDQIAKDQAVRERKALELKQEEARAAEQARIEREHLEQGKIAEQKRRDLEASRPKNTREVSKFEVTDLSILPREYTLPDMKKIGEALAAGKMVPGVRTYKETVVVAR